jgi:hypothetical protein
MNLWGDWFFLHKIEVFTKWGFCKITLKALFFTHILTVLYISFLVVLKYTVCTQNPMMNKLFQNHVYTETQLH